MILPAEMLAPAVTALGLRLVLDPLVKGVVLLVLAHLVLGVFRRRSSHWRSAAWTLLLITLVALPATVVLTPRLTTPLVTVTTPRPESGAANLAGAGFEADAAAPADAPRWTPAKGAPSHSGGFLPLWVAGGLLWGAGTRVLLLRTVWRLAAARRALRRALPTGDPRLLRLFAVARGRESGPSPRLLVSREFPTPFVAGLRRPAVVLPDAVTGWSDSEILAVMRHELAHVRRHDLWRLLAADLACAVHWPNPLAWAAAGRAALSHEMACDDHAQADGSPREYARTLLGLAARVPASGHPVPAPGLSRTDQIEARLRHILRAEGREATRSCRRRLLGAGGVSLAVIVCCLPALVLSTVRVVPDGGEAHGAADLRSTTFAASPQPLDVASAPATGQSIHQLVRQGADGAVLVYLENRPEMLELRDENGMTPLALAVWHDRRDLVGSLLERGADPDARNVNGLTPIFTALDRGRGGLARVLADGGADLGVLGYRQWTLLHAAARIGDAGFVARLLAAGLDPNVESTVGRTPLHLARRHDFRATVTALLDAGALDTPNPRPWPAFASKHGVRHR